MRIKRSAFEALLAQARAELPNESCGYLFGTADDDDLAVEHFPMTNADHSPEHFSFVPAEQFAALRAARAKGRRIIANWHSHPASPSRPSQEDIRLANDPSILYCILSLQAEEPVFNAFRIVGGQVQKFNVDVVDD